MRILMVQNKPCIRNYKEAVALTKLGHDVHLACEKNPLGDRYGLTDWPEWYRSVTQIYAPHELVSLAPWFDVIHCHNEPDSYSTAATVSDVPSIHDTHDLMSSRGLGFSVIEEGIANRFSDGCVYVSEQQRQRAESVYRVGARRPSVVCRSLVLERDIPKSPRAKLSEKDGAVHFVYEGGINNVRHTHRWMAPMFKKILDAGAFVHLYAHTADYYTAEYAKMLDVARFVIHKPLPLSELIEEMTQYDAGLCVFHETVENRRHLDQNLPNKLWEYIAAGLVPVCSPFAEMSAFVAESGRGVLWGEDDDAEKLVSLVRYAMDTQATPVFDLTMENEVRVLDRLYRQLVSAPKGDIAHLAFPELPWEVLDGQNMILFRPKPESGMVRRSLVGLDPSADTLKLEQIVAHGALGDV